ncbi:30S ribosomal protein S4 [Candidatus Marinamargulisbacteria bacterium SCGC AAA071-K20]|nr:30S ribosomal protein S4 [Candidatus Marinamargulisbacteria bacterium SCGC AAA071-K20]
MSRYRGPSCKLCRRAREKLFLKGDRCQTAKCAIEKRNYPPGYRALKPKKISEYGKRLREKQKLRFYYGVTEKQMRIYFAKASKKKGITGHNLLSLFEQRLDNIVFRANMGKSRKDARQLVKHSHFLVNGKKADIPSMLIKKEDVISIKEKSITVFKDLFDILKDKPKSSWVVFNDSEKSITVDHGPTREEIDVPVDEQLIVEFYSK